MPAPTDIEHIKGINPETQEEEERPSSDDEPFAALAFKIATDPYVGKLCFFRVYSGTVTAGSTVYNSVKDDQERMGRILQMHANHRKDLEICYAGDIAAAVGLKNTTTGDTLCDPKAPYYPGVYGIRIQLSVLPSNRKRRLARKKMGIGLGQTGRRGSDFKTYTDQRRVKLSLPVWASCI